MQRRLMFLFIFFPVICFSQNKPISPEVIESVCRGSEGSAWRALVTLAARTSDFKDLTLEKIRSSYVESMTDESERIKSLLNTSAYDMILDASSSNFKYALCEKMKRPSTAASTIASEVYFLCRTSITTKSEQKPAPCF